jgi:uncharacterized membrane protein
MTQSIDRETRARAASPAGSEPVTITRNRLIVGVRCFVGLMVLKAMAFLIAAFAFAGWRSALAAATFFILAVLGGVVLTIDALLASRSDFYQRGQLDGWYRGYRMQPPELDDPLLH